MSRIMADQGESVAGEPSGGGLGVSELAAGARWGLLAAVFVLSIVCFWPAAGQGFVDWDDDRLFKGNPYWRGLSAENLRWMFATWTAYGSYYMGHYQPLTWLSHAIEFELWGESAERMHLVNMLLHGLNAVLFCLISVRLLSWHRAERAGAGLWIGSALAALLFSMHPLRVESVAWATERRDLLSSFFLFLCVLAWLGLQRRQGLRLEWWALVLALYVLSLASKAWGMTLPVLLLLIDVWPLRRVESGGGELRSLVRLALEKLPFLPFAVLTAVLAARAQGSFGATVGFGEHGILARAAQASYGLVFYVVKTFWPVGLSPLYELEIDLDPTRAVYLGAISAVVAVTVALVLLRKKRPGWLAAWVIYGVTVAPVLGLLQSGAQRVADRYSYLACLPFALLLGAGAHRLLERGNRTKATALLAASTAVLTILGVLTWRQTTVWRDNETLWNHVIRLQPSSYIAHHNLAAALQGAGRIDEAIESEKRSIEAHPGKGNEQTRHNLGLLYQRTGRPDLAFEAWRGAVRVAPSHEPSIQALVSELRRRGDPDGARKVWEDAIAQEPDFMNGYLQLALMLLQEGKGLQAEELLRRGYRRNPKHGPLLHALGTVVYGSGRYEEGEGLLRQALRVDPNSPDTLAELARVLASKPDDASQGQAMRMLEQALSINPNHVRARELARELGVSQF